MNRLSVVLAADSATTVSYWNGSKNEERYFKGANKIFQLSNEHPIGIMICDAADILRVPWETLIKDFRKVLGARSFNDVAGYANEFVGYIDGNVRFLPLEVRKNEFLGHIVQAVIGMIFSHKGETPEDQEEKYGSLYDAAGSAIYGNFSPLSESEVDALIHKHDAEVKAKFAEWTELLKFSPRGDASYYVRYILIRALENIQTRGPQTGLVFAGFGDHSVFPELVHLGSCKFWEDRFIPGTIKKDAPDYENPAVISGFAQTSMSDTFSLGFSGDVWVAFGEAIAEGAAQMVGEIETALGGTLELNKKVELIRALDTGIRRRVMDHALDQHATPLRRVLGVLPVDEMGELAETLINLQSLKEKVTKPSETVGGPVDVAAITRGEGLVWIKRKHYFDPSINSRYFDRRSRQ